MFRILLSLIILRPFISSLAFPYLNCIYSGLFLIFLGVWLTCKKDLSPKEIQGLKYSLILFSLTLIVSVFFSINKFNGLKEVYKYITGMLLFLVVVSLNTDRKIRVIRAIVLSSLIISILAIYQYFFGFRHILNYLAQEGIADSSTLDHIVHKRIFYPFVTPNILAGYLAMTIPLALIQKDKIWLILPMFLTLILTKSLGAFLSLFLGIGLYLCLKRDMGSKKYFVLGTLAASFIFIFIFRQMPTKAHLLPLFSLTQRLNYWQDTLKVIKTHPFVGVGLGNFNLASSRYAHNSYLQLWAETGIFGLVSFGWLIYSVIRAAIKKIDTSPHNIQSISLITACVIFLIHNLLEFSLFLPEVSLVWWVILGLLSTPLPVPQRD